MRKVAVLLTVVLVLSGVSSSYGQETASEQTGRRGFIIGFGVGPGYSHVKQTIEFGYYEFSGSIDKAAVNTDFKIGLAVNRQTLVYWSSRVAWFADEIGSLYYNYSSGSYYMVSEDATFASGVGGIGVSYYLRPSLPSLYFTGTLGYSSFGTPFNDNYDTEYGVGGAAGIGYEFAPHWTFEAIIVYGHTTHNELSTNALSLKATINLLSF